MSALRLTAARMVGNGTRIAGKTALQGSAVGLTKLTQARSICHKDHIDPEVLESKPKPWPYLTKKYTWFHQNLFRTDFCVERFDENTKVIVVEGNIGAGKSRFAKELADQLGMKHFPEPTLDDVFITKTGFDYRTLNWRVPESAQLVDIRMFYENPHHIRTGNFQGFMYKVRFGQYIDALSHLFNTGQGVVLERCLWSDSVFLDTLYKQGFIKEDGHRFLTNMKIQSERDMLRPHLVIYLDVSVDTSMERIKKRNIPYEVKSKVMTKEYLQLIEDNYKNKYLPQISQHAELLVYDWTNYGDMDLVIEDLEKLDFDQYEARGEKMEDWRMYTPQDFDEQRRKFSNCREVLYANMNIPEYDTPSLETPDEICEMRDKVYNMHGPKYQPNWDPSIHGWFGVLFGLGDNYIDRQKLPLWGNLHPRNP